RCDHHSRLPYGWMKPRINQQRANTEEQQSPVARQGDAHCSRWNLTERVTQSPRRSHELDEDAGGEYSCHNQHRFNIGADYAAPRRSTTDRAVSVVDVGKRVQQLLLTTVPVAFSLFFESPFVEVEKVSRHKLVRISSGKVPGRPVFSQPRLSDKHRSVLALDCNHRVVELNLEGQKLLHIWLCQRIAVDE